MGWADSAIAKLKDGQEVTVCPKGNSMLPLVKTGDICLISPVTESTVLDKGDIVLVKVRGSVYLHLVSALRGTDSYQISNNHGHVNGWVHRSSIYGKLTAKT